ncbi:DUF222 domain-containing protein [Agrococcus sp. ProA11]|uniref:HNH endonuclease signature motif containing protein n=1 Tax=Agrococcus chionoecetis TaxID=3153752 RepID=UPI0032616587
MDTREIDGEDYIAAVRAGAIDPFGHTAAELQASLDAYDREWGERLAALSDDELDAVVAGRMMVPQLPGPAESDYTAHLRAEAAFVGRMRALEAQTARLEAEQREVLAARLSAVLAAGGNIDTARRESASVLAAELHLSDRTIEQRMTGAWQLVHELPAAHEAHKAGRITAGHLRTIEQATRTLRLDDAVSATDRTRIEAELVELAERTTPGQLRSRAPRIVDRVLTAPLQQRFDAAREQRAAWVSDAGDGMVDIGARVPAAFGYGVFDRLTQAARGKAKDDPRTFDQYRADAFLELLLCGQVPEDLTGVSAFTATIAVTIPATALLRDDPLNAGAGGADGEGESDPELRFPAMLDGRILVDPDTIRDLATDTVTWERLFLHPVTGIPITVDTYQPTRAMRRWLKARDGRCRWPGCNHPVTRADTDHTRAYANGGTTALTNLAHLCRRHHTMKHATRWTVQQLAGGVLEWTSPLGDTIRDDPEPQGPRFTTTLNRPLFDAGSFRVWKEDSHHAEADPGGDEAASDPARARPSR